MNITSFCQSADLKKSLTIYIVEITFGIWAKHQISVIDKLIIFMSYFYQFYVHWCNMSKLEKNRSNYFQFTNYIYS